MSKPRPHTPASGQTPCPDRPEATPLARDEAAGGQALLIIDMLGDWRFEDADTLLANALFIAPAIRSLKQRCRQAGVPVIYANDNRGRWRSDFRALVHEGLAAGGQRAELNRQLQPDDEDYFVLKPKHSAFFATPLDLLLSHLKAHRLILTGTTTDQCVLATAIDARIRDYELVCPADGMAAQDPVRQAHALWHLTEILGLDTPASTALRLPGEARAPSPGHGHCPGGPV